MIRPGVDSDHRVGLGGQSPRGKPGDLGLVVRPDPPAECNLPEPRQPGRMPAVQHDPHKTAHPVDATRLVITDSPADTVPSLDPPATSPRHTRRQQPTPRVPFLISQVRLTEHALDLLRTTEDPRDGP